MTTIFVKPTPRRARKQTWRESAKESKPKGRAFRQRYEWDTYAVGAGFKVGTTFADACRVRQAASHASRRGGYTFVFRVRREVKTGMYFAVRIK